MGITRNLKHSELARAYEKEKQRLNSAECMLGYLSYDYRINPKSERPRTPREVWNNTEYNEYKEMRKEARRNCNYLKKMINQTQRSYSRKFCNA